MMHLVATGIAWACLAGGVFFLVVGAVGLLRFPDFFTRMHGAGITDTLGVGLTLVGFCFLAGWSMTTIKLLIILVFLWFTNPVATHALAKAALRDGRVPITADDAEEQEEDGSSES